MHVLIPAGGRGVRLRPLTNDRPKPLLPLGDRPILTHIIDRIPVEWPIVVLITPELEPCFQEWARSVAHRNVRLVVEKPRGPGLGGPVLAIADCMRELGIRDDLLVMMGDSVLPFTIQDFLAGGDPAALRLAAYRLPDLRDASRFGVLELAADGTVASFEEKPAQPRSPWVFTGCLHIPAEHAQVLGSLSDAGLSQMGHLVGRYLELGAPVQVFPVSGAWHDIGTFASYLEAHRAFASGDPRDPLSSGNRFEGVVYVHPSATGVRSRLNNCIVFDGARVEGAELSNCVIQARVSVADRVIRHMLLTPGSEFAFPEGAGR